MHTFAYARPASLAEAVALLEEMRESHGDAYVPSPGLLVAGQYP